MLKLLWNIIYFIIFGFKPGEKVTKYWITLREEYNDSTLNYEIKDGIILQAEYILSYSIYRDCKNEDDGEYVFIRINSIGPFYDSIVAEKYLDLLLERN